MTHVFPFYGTIQQCWRVLYSEYNRLHGALGHPPFQFSSPKHTDIQSYLPQDGDEIIIDFLVNQTRDVVLVVDVETIPDEIQQCNIFVHPQGNMFVEPHKSAQSIWQEVKNTMREQGYLTVPNTIIQKPTKLDKPAHGSNLDDWFDWYHSMLDAGFKVTLEQIAKETGYVVGTVKQKHSLYIKKTKNSK